MQSYDSEPIDTFEKAEREDLRESNLSRRRPLEFINLKEVAETLVLDFRVYQEEVPYINIIPPQPLGPAPPPMVPNISVGVQTAPLPIQ
ncbi:unnamed protein product [Sphagnum balticum]